MVFLKDNLPRYLKKNDLIFFVLDDLHYSKKEKKTLQMQRRKKDHMETDYSVALKNLEI